MPGAKLQAKYRCGSEGSVNNGLKKSCVRLRGRHSPLSLVWYGTSASTQWENSLRTTQRRTKKTRTLIVLFTAKLTI
mgnify:CR=1 FL=1